MALIAPGKGMHAADENSRAIARRFEGIRQSPVVLLDLSPCETLVTLRRRIETWNVFQSTLAQSSGQARIRGCT